MKLTNKTAFDEYLDQVNDACRSTDREGSAAREAVAQGLVERLWSCGLAAHTDGWETSYGATGGIILGPYDAQRLVHFIEHSGHRFTKQRREVR